MEKKLKLIIPWSNSPGVRKMLRYMKMTLVILLVTVMQTWAIVSYSQTAALSISLKNAPVQTVLQQIEDQSDFYFLYSRTVVDVDRTVDVQFKDAKITEVLNTLFNGTDVVYKVDGRQIVLSKKSESSETDIQQQKSVSGKVTDSTGAGLPGVSVVVKGTAIGATTDSNGNYSIDNVSGNSTLQFSFIGMKKEEIAVGGKSTINVVLTEESIDVDEVVVVGYGTQKKANLSGAVGTVSTETIANRPIRSIGEGLQGAVAGLNIDISNGRSASVPSINIRGYESINGGTPLIIIDGVSASESELARLNPNDVESMSVLKDAASCAIYGARASFGVLLIKTKSGTGKMTVTYNGGLSYHNACILPTIVTDPYIVMTTKAAAAYPYYTNLYSDEVIEYAKKVSEGQVPSVRLNPQDNKIWQNFASMNWFNEIYRDYASTQDHNVSISGKDNKVSYYFSGAYFDENGIIRHGNDKYKRYNLRSKVDFKITDWLTLGNNTSWETTNYNEPNHQSYWLMFHQIDRQNSYEPVYNPDGSYTSTGAYMVGGSETSRANTINSILQTQMLAEISLVKNVWKLNADFTIRKGNWNQKKFGVAVPYKEGPDLPVKYQYNSSYATQGNSLTTYRGLNLYTKAEKNIGKHYLAAMVGFNQEESIYDYFDTSKSDLISSSLPSIQLATGLASNSASYSDWAVRGLFGRLNYSFNDRYIFEANGRYDGSSRFPHNDRFGFFPSFSFAWRLDKESFMPDLPFITSLKPRVSWGSLGNQSVSNYAYIASMSSKKISQILQGTQPIAIYQPGLVANNLTWETVTSQNLGLDMSMFRNKLDLSFDMYQRMTKDMLTKSKTLPSVLGATEPQENAADLMNKGWEFTINWHSDKYVMSSPFTYSIGFNISDSRAWITKFDNPGNYLDDYYVGREIGEIWGLKSLPLYQTTEELLNHAYEDHFASDEVNYKAVGDVQWKDLNGDGKITRGAWRYGDSGDFSVIGNNQSRYRYGINVSLEWKSFDLRLFGQGVGKKDYYPGSGNHYFWGVLAQPWAQPTQHVLDNVWTPTNLNGYFPRLKAYAAEDASLELGIPQTRYLINAAYFRLKNVTLGYSLPTSMIKKLNLSKVRIFVGAENILTLSEITKYGMDPEVLSGSGDYPMQKKVSMGLNVIF